MSDRPVRVLVVGAGDEDLGTLLGRPDLETLRAGSAREAIALLAVHEPAFVLVQLGAAAPDAAAIVDAIRDAAAPGGVPLLLVSDDAALTGRVLARHDAGLVDVLPRPVDPRLLRARAAVFFELHRLRVERESEGRLNEILVAAVGHDLRSPLSAVLMASELLGRICTQPDERRLVDRIRSSGRHMARLVDDLHDAARLRRGELLELNLTPDTDLRPLAEGVLAEHRSTQRSRELRVDAIGDTVGEWDPDRMTRVLANLVTHALRHGQPEAAVVVELDGSAPDTLVARVATGGELPGERLARVWEPFDRGRVPDAREVGGPGVRLYIVKQIALAHGGSVDVRVGEGRTVVELVLPRG